MHGGHNLVGGKMLAASTAGSCPLVRCHDVGCQTTLLHSGLSPTILTPFGCHQQITPCSIGAGCPIMTCRDRLAILDAPSCVVLLDVAAVGPCLCAFFLV